MSKTKRPTDVDRCRMRIDQIDSKVASLLTARVQLASQIISAKNLAGTATTDPKRERAIVKRYLAALKHPIKSKRVHTLVKAILELSPRYRS